MAGVVLIVVMALPLEAALVLLWFGPLRNELTRPPQQSNFWGTCAWVPEVGKESSRAQHSSSPDTLTTQMRI